MLRSFFIGGFECATGFNMHHEWIDQVAATQHDRFMNEDYALLASSGIRTSRDGVRWPVIDKPGGYDFQSLDSLVEAAAIHGVQVIFDLFHYGYPDDIDIFSDAFIDRFASYCHAVAERVAFIGEPPYLFTPINEPSYFAWAAGDACLFAPHACGRSFELKVQLAKAAIAGINAIRSVIPEARIVNVDPLCRVACPVGRFDLAEEVQWFNERVVFESWDMLSGRLLPELGGSPSHLDILGVNYYWTNQWEHLRPETPLDAKDERLWPLQDLLRWVWHRYGHDMILTETAHVARNRSSWIRHVADEAEAVLNEGLPLRGACFYPVLGMPEWHARDTWTRMGLWDLQAVHTRLRRTPHRPSLQALNDAQIRLEGLTFTTAGIPRILSGDHHLY